MGSVRRAMRSAILHQSKQRTKMKLSNSEVPCQLPADLPSAVELEQLPDGAVRFAAIKRCLSRGLVGTQPSAHFSLDLNTPTAGGAVPSLQVLQFESVLQLMVCISALLRGLIT